MKYTSKQTGNSRNKALLRRAARLGCGISMVAVSAVLAARTAQAGPSASPASIISSSVPSESSSAGFVTSGSAQTNTGNAITADVEDASGASTVENINTGLLPSTASVTGNKLAAYATGSGQTNTVDFETIGTGTLATGISVLADQENIYLNYGEDLAFYTPETINANVTDSSLDNTTTNAVSGDALTDSSNLITAQVEGNVADSSVNGVVPITYDTPKAGGVTTNAVSAAASGNVVVASSQTDNTLFGGVGSFATLGSDNIDLNVGSSGEDAQSLGFTAAVSNNTASSVYLGNSAANDIGVALTAGTLTGAPSLAGALVISNEQAATGVGYGGTTLGGIGAITNSISIGGIIGGEPSITLADGSATVDNNVISSSATNNSAVGMAGAPGNEITLGVNLAGATTGGDSINTISGEGGLATGADLALSNQQYEIGPSLQGFTSNFGIYATIQNMAGSTAQVSNNVASSSALGNDASNAIDSASGAGIDLISGLAALTSEQIGEGESSATTQYGQIAINAGFGDTGLSLTNSSVNLSGDQITTNAGVNQVTNAESLSASTIDAGALGAAVGPANVTLASDGDSQAAAGLSLNNDQFAYDAGEATAYESAVIIGAYVSGLTLSNNSVVVSNPVLSAVATADSAGNSISADGSQGISGSIGLLNTQRQGAGGASATLTEGDGSYSIAGISEESYREDGITGSSALLTGTSLSAEATDNYASNTLDATGGTLANAVDGTLGLAAQLSDDAVTGAAQAYSDLALSNVQTDFNEEALASNSGTAAVIDANADGGTISGSSFTVSGPANDAPTSQALALGNEALNMLTAAASTVMKDTAGLLNTQADSTGASAALDGSFAYASINGAPTSEPSEDGNDGGNVSDTSVVVGTGAVGGSNANVLRALAYGNQATNEFSATAGSIAPADTGLSDYAVDGSVLYNDPPFNSTLASETNYGVGAAYALLNDQESSGLVSASALFDSVGAYIGNATTNPAVTQVTESTAGNAEVSSAFGNQADNSGAVSAGNLSVGVYTPLADVTNIQSGLGDVEAYLSNEDSTDSFTSQVDGDGEVSDSTIGVTDNSAITQVEANQAANSLDTTGGDITDVSTSALPGLSGYTYDEGAATASAAFTVQNLQLNQPTVSVQQPDSNALLAIGGTADVSTLTADGNAFEATGYVNNATSTLDFGGTDSPVDVLDTSSGLQNVQFSDGDHVTLGSPGTLASPGTPDTVIPAVDYSVAAGTNTGVLSNNGETLQVEGNPLVFDLSGLTPTERTDFENLFFFTEGSVQLVGSSLTLTSGTYTLGSTDIFGTSDGNAYHTSGGALTDQPTLEEVTLNDGTPATPAVPPSPSVLITVGGNITESTLDASNNAFDATALANNAVNTESIAATTVNGGSDIAVGTGIVENYEGEASADYALSNLQSIGYTVSATGNGEVGINPTNDSAITDSTLTVSNNTQLTKAEADVASNTLSLAATSTAGTPPNMILTSYQYDDSSVTATNGTAGDSFDPGYVITAPGAINSSTLTMDNNSSESLAAVNDVTNLVSAAATTLDTKYASPNYASASTTSEYSVSADYGLTNAQLASDGSATSTDSTQLINSDYSSVTTTGLVSSTVDISGNTTSAFAEANTAANTVDMTATNSTAKGALLNDQNSSDTVGATAAGEVEFGLNGSIGDPGSAAATDSAINVSNNTVQAQGIGNQATNALNADTGATYGTQGEALSNPEASQATYTVLNAQSNTAGVSANAGAFVASGLSSGDSSLPVLNSTVTVTYNLVDAKAFGNSANNSMTVATLNAGNATAALQNTQTNTGAITSTVSNSQFGSFVDSPGVSNATVEVGSNSVVASAIGNVATNSIAH